MTVFSLITQGIDQGGIKNPALPANVGIVADPGAGGTVLATYIGILWQTLIILGGLALLVNLLMGGLTWVTGGGEKGKVEEAKNRITQSIVGFAVLASVAAISIFLSRPFGIDLLKPTFPSILDLDSSAPTSNILETAPLYKVGQA